MLATEGYIQMYSLSNDVTNYKVISNLNHYGIVIILVTYICCNDACGVNW